MPRGCYMKQTLQNRFPRRWLLLAFVLNFAIAAAALLPYMIRDGGLLLVAADFDAEQLSYNMLCNNAIKSGEVLWNWRIDIGSDFVSSFSFYTLGSPFFWLSFLFPASAFQTRSVSLPMVMRRLFLWAISPCIQIRKMFL